MVKSFRCTECKTFINVSQHGNLTECEHHPFTELGRINSRHDFQYVLAELVRTKNPVTKWSLREILVRRLECGDLS